MQSPPVEERRKKKRTRSLESTGKAVGNTWLEGEPGGEEKLCDGIAALTEHLIFMSSFLGDLQLFFLHRPLTGIERVCMPGSQTEQLGKTSVIEKQNKQINQSVAGLENQTNRTNPNNPNKLKLVLKARTS